jgi:hypothetical protein
MAIISTFELLLKPQLPKALTSRFPELAPLTRTILQGYFLTISNLDDKGVVLSVTFVTRTPGLDTTKVLSTFDIQNQNGPVSLIPAGPAPGQPTPGNDEVVKTKYSVFLNPNDTGLLLIQADATQEKIRTATDFEIRGYVELSLSSENMQQTGKVLVTAEHRGTFFDGANKDALGEIAYALPLASGGSLIELQRS